jgi:hypothetical protein
MQCHGLFTTVADKVALEYGLLLSIPVRITAIFEQWYIGDGTYPPLRKDDLVNLAFEMYPEVLRSNGGEPTRMHHAGNALYEFTGIVLRHYCEANQTPVLLIEVDGFRFYISDGGAQRGTLQPGATGFRTWNIGSRSLPLGGVWTPIRA